MIKGLVSLNELIHSTQCKNIYIYIYMLLVSQLFFYIPMNTDYYFIK